MTTRFNGYNHDSRLGYFQGDNALVSVAVQQKDAAGAFEVKVTGVRAPLVEYKRMYSLLHTADVAATIYKHKTTEVLTAVDKSADSDYEDIGINTPELANMYGGGIANDAGYLEAFAAQENLRRLVDIIQQRAVIMGVSAAGATTTNTDALTTTAGWTSAITSTATALVHTVTFMVERATVFDKLRPNMYGQPEGTEPVVGQELVLDLAGLPMLKKDATEGVALGADAANYAVRIDKAIPRIQ